jgi:hypothetical protein
MASTAVWLRRPYIEGRAENSCLMLRGHQPTTPQAAPDAAFSRLEISMINLARRLSEWVRALFTSRPKTKAEEKRQWEREPY